MEEAQGAGTPSRALLDGPFVPHRAGTSNLSALCRMLQHLDLLDDHNSIFHEIIAMGSNHSHAFYSFLSLSSS